MEEQRTKKQNKSIHLFCRKLANELNGKGYYMQLVLKPTYELRWDDKAVKEHLLKPVIKMLFQTEHTSELTKQEITKAHEQLMMMLMESPKLKELDYIDFPSEEQTENYINSFNK